MAVSRALNSYSGCKIPNTSLIKIPLAQITMFFQNPHLQNADGNLQPRELNLWQISPLISPRFKTDCCASVRNHFKAPMK